jgi:peptide/nickel transport system permease protein
MARMAARRLLFLPLAIFIVVTFAFAVVNLTPGDPARVIAGGLAGEEQLAEIRADLGIDKPIPQRYVAYMSQLASGDLGQSFFTRNSIASEIAQRLPATLELVVLSLVVAALIGLALGGLGAYFRRRAPDRLAKIVIAMIQAVPDFFLGLVLVYLVFFVLGWAPAPVGRLGLLDIPPPRVTGATITDSLISGDWALARRALHHAMLPIVTLGLFYSAYFAKTARATLVSAFESRQVEFARACGLPEWKVVGYALRQARTPIMTYAAILFSTLIGGAALVEVVFAWGGIGEWAIGRILNLDLPAIQGFVLVAGLITLLTYIALDLLVAALDPRISYRGD